MNRAVLLAVLLMTGCATRKGGVTVRPESYKAQVALSLDASRNRLVSVGAPVRSSVGDIKVTFRQGTDRTYLGWGFRHDSTGSIIGGLKAGDHTTIATAPDGAYQPLIAEIELSHQWLKGTEESDYAWIRKAYPEWRGP